MQPEDEIWTGACAEAGRPKSLTAPGDRALADMILAHSLAMNGGVVHAVESLTTEERAAAVEGYRYFGLDAAARVLEDIARRFDGVLDDDEAERLEVEADERYASVVADDEVLANAFVEQYRREPTAFVPID
jgi:hypothetical protein